MGKTSSDLKVYAIWFDMFPGDSRSNWPNDLLTDPRGVHLWDEQKIIGTWYVKHPEYCNSNYVLWDAFLIYGREAYWEDKPSHFIGMGRPIISKREELRSKLLAILQ